MTSHSAPFETSNLTRADDAFLALRTAIVKGEIAPGSKINEPQLATQLGVSRGPLREAIRRLEGCKLVEIKPNAGARVIQLNAEQLLEIYEIREALEGLAARLAAERADAQQIEELEALLGTHHSEIQSAHGEIYYQAEGEWDYHYQLVSMSGNQRLFDTLCGELYHVMRMYRVRASTTPQRPNQAFKEHQHILEAIANRDGELAEILMRRHIRGAQRELVSQLNQASSNPQQDEQ
ncbi:GntR family transcriptional regulator [Aurantivibrio plasticivorans]